MTVAANPVDPEKNILLGKKLFEAVDWPLMLPRLIVDRIRRDGRRPPVCSLCGASVRFRAPPVPESEKKLRTARFFFPTTHYVSNPVAPASIFYNKKKEFPDFFRKLFLRWVDRIRTCGMTAPKAVGLPLADDPKMPTII